MCLGTKVASCIFTSFIGQLLAARFANVLALHWNFKQVVVRFPWLARSLATAAWKQSSVKFTFYYFKNSLLK